MKQQDIILTGHHLQDMYKALGVLTSSLSDIKPYISKEAYSTLADDISSIDQIIDGLESDLYYYHLKRV